MPSGGEVLAQRSPSRPAIGPPPRTSTSWWEGAPAAFSGVSCLDALPVVQCLALHLNLFLHPFIHAAILPTFSLSQCRVGATGPLPFSPCCASVFNVSRPPLWCPVLHCRQLADLPTIVISWPAPYHAGWTCHRPSDCSAGLNPGHLVPMRQPYTPISKFSNSSNQASGNPFHVWEAHRV